MKTKLFFCSLVLLVSSAARGQGTAFTYQGRLNDGASPANGFYDLTFSLFAANAGGVALSVPVTNSAVLVSNGLFTTAIDFGSSAFLGSSNWMEIGVRTNGAIAFSTLTPRQLVTPVPYAIMANAASNLLGTLPAGQLNGSVASANLSGTYRNSLTLSNAANQLAGVFTGNGASISNVNAVSLGGMAASSFWQLGGNNVAPGQFIGSTNNQPVEIWVNNARAVRLAPVPNDATRSNIINVVNGSPVNFVAGGVAGATIAGGGAAKYSGGNFSNSVTADFGTVSGGYQNTSSGALATVGGGEVNVAGGPGTTVAGGFGNSSTGSAAAIGGGQGNQATNDEATVPGGLNNLAGGLYSFAAGQRAKATNQGAFVWSDSQNADFSSTNNDSFNVRAQGGARFVTSGAGMIIDGQSVLTTGNTSNGISIQENSFGSPNIIEGCPSNLVLAGVVGATISGGGEAISPQRTNSVTGDFGTVSGGFANTADFAATVGGGHNNTAGGADSTVGGGLDNTAESGTAGTVGGGDLNKVQNHYATVSGGTRNIASGPGAAVGGGGFDGLNLGGNVASGGASVVPGGHNNLASGTYSFAAGQRAKAIHDGAFVWADSQAADFSSATNDEFSIRSQNGVRIATDKGIHLNAADRPLIVRDWDPFATNAPASKVGIGRWGLFMEPTILTIGIPAVDAGVRYFQVATYSTNATITQLLLVDQSGNVTAKGNVTANGVLLTSDRNAKENFTPLDAKTVLEKVAALPLSQWNYKNDGVKQKHLGPMAQDFHAAFGLDGDDDKHISVVDEGGVALAAIQGLNQKLQEQLNSKDAEIAKLQMRLEKLEKAINPQNH